MTGRVAAILAVGMPLTLRRPAMRRPPIARRRFIGLTSVNPMTRGAGQSHSPIPAQSEGGLRDSHQYPPQTSTTMTTIEHRERRSRAWSRQRGHPHTLMREPDQPGR